MAPSIYLITRAILSLFFPIKTYVEYARLEEKNGRVELTSDYADMFGWKEQVKSVASV